MFVFLIKVDFVVWSYSRLGTFRLKFDKAEREDWYKIGYKQKWGIPEIKQIVSWRMVCRELQVLEKSLRLPQWIKWLLNKLNFNIINILSLSVKLIHPNSKSTL